MKASAAVAHGKARAGYVSILLVAVLAALLGLVLGVIRLAAQPSVLVRELPDEEARLENTHYIVTGESRGGATYRSKWAGLEQGRSGIYEFSVAELNSWAQATIRPTPVAAPQPEGEDAEAKQPFSAPIVEGTPNFNIIGDQLQISADLKLKGLEQPVTWVTQGQFANDGGVQVFEPTQTYLGNARMPAGLDSVINNLVLRLYMTRDEGRAFVQSWRRITSTLVSDEGFVVRVQ
jgi:hypothetical protein